VGFTSDFRVRLEDVDGGPGVLGNICERCGLKNRKRSWRTETMKTKPKYRTSEGWCPNSTEVSTIQNFLSTTANHDKTKHRLQNLTMAGIAHGDLDLATALVILANSYGYHIPPVEPLVVGLKLQCGIYPYSDDTVAWRCFLIRPKGSTGNGSLSPPSDMKQRLKSCGSACNANLGVFQDG
jgi:hypothetical protein